jgi:hypothetical protein
MRFGPAKQLPPSFGARFGLWTAERAQHLRGLGWWRSAPFYFDPSKFPALASLQALARMTTLALNDRRSSC